MNFLWVLLFCAALVLVVLGVLVLAAAAASRSKQRPPADADAFPLLPKAESPYRKLYKK